MAFYIPYGMECIFLHYKKGEPTNTLEYWSHVDWCKNNGVVHWFDQIHDHLPTRLWLTAEDAVAFKLTFKL